MRENKAIEERVSRELQAHSVNDVLKESYALKNRFHHIWSYKSRLNLFSDMNSYLKDITDKDILDVGCGRGDFSINYLRSAARVSGIDITPEYILDANNKAKNLDLFNYSFKVMDAHYLDYNENTFDIVIGEGILHHLEAKQALNEMWRVLKPNGRLLFVEPLADNPLLKIFRLLTPKARTKDEKPFTGTDVERVIDPNKWLIQNKFCGIIEAPISIFTSLTMPKHPNNLLLQYAHKIEEFSHKKNILPFWNQYILFNLIKKDD